MFVIRMHNILLDELQKEHLALGYQARELAALVRDYRTFLTSQISAFHHAQGKALHRALADGRLGTISEARSSDSGEFALARKSGYLLHSIDLADARSISNLETDDYSYVCPLWLRSSIARKDGDPVAIMVYLDPVQCGYICWIGTRATLADGYHRIDHLSEGLTRFAAIDAAYNQLIGRTD